MASVDVPVRRVCGGSIVVRYTDADADAAMRARNRYQRRHGKGPLALMHNLQPRVRSAGSWPEAERRVRAYLRRNRRRFYWCHPDDAVRVSRYDLWAGVSADESAKEPKPMTWLARVLSRLKFWKEPVF